MPLEWLKGLCLNSLSLSSCLFANLLQDGFIIASPVPVLCTEADQIGNCFIMGNGIGYPTDLQGQLSDAEQIVQAKQQLIVLQEKKCMGERFRWNGWSISTLFLPSTAHGCCSLHLSCSLHLMAKIDHLKNIFLSPKKSSALPSIDNIHQVPMCVVK